MCQKITTAIFKVTDSSKVLEHVVPQPRKLECGNDTLLNISLRL
jgi:hypothetical protein